MSTAAFIILWTPLFLEWTGLYLINQGLVSSEMILFNHMMLSLSGCGQNGTEIMSEQLSCCSPSLMVESEKSLAPEEGGPAQQV